MQRMIKLDHFAVSKALTNPGNNAYKWLITSQQERQSDIYICPDGNKHHQFSNSLACVCMCVCTQKNMEK